MIVLPNLTHAGDGPGLAALLTEPGWLPQPAATIALGLPSAAVMAGAIAVAGGNQVQTVSVEANSRIERINYGGEIYTLAQDPNSLQPGEYSYNSATGAIQIRPRSQFVSGHSLRVEISNPASVLVEYELSAAAGLPDIFQRYNLTGAVAWGCDWEGQPQGQFELICDWATADELEQQLIPLKTSLTLFGIGFEVAGLQITKRSPLECPQLEARVTVSLRGQWERYLEERVMLDTATPSGQQPSGGRTIRGDTTIQQIAAKVGAVAIAPANRIEAPRQAGQGQEVTLQEAFEGNLRHNRSFARYSNPSQIEAVRLDGVKTHTVPYSELYNTALEISINAYPRALEIKNGRLEWGSAAPLASNFLEDTQGAAQQNLPLQWRVLPPARLITITGSIDMDPPVDVVDLVDSSFVFDNGGPTRERSLVWTENGATMREQLIKKGFAAVAHSELYNRSVDGNGRPNWTPRSAAILPSLWKTIEQLETEYLYDSQTGYLLEIVTRGWRLGRLQSESSNESLQAWDDWNKTGDQEKKNKKLILLNSYDYYPIPVYERTVYYARPYRAHYWDIPPRPTEEYLQLVPEFDEQGNLNPLRIATVGQPREVTRQEINGKSYLEIPIQVPVPGWTEPQFCLTELNQRSCFLSRPHPESTPKDPKPDLATGEDRRQEKYIYVGNFRDRPRQSGAYQIAETYQEYEHLQTQKDGGFKRAAREVTGSQNAGRPGEHTRKETIYEKIDPSDTGEGQPVYEWVINTVAGEDDRIIGDTASYPYARNFQEAIAGLETDLEITNTRDTKTVSVEVPYAPIQEGDLIQLEGHGLWRVLNYSKAIAILAPGVLQPQRMTLDLGKVITAPAIAVERRLVPQEGEQQTENLNPLAMAANPLLGVASRGNRNGV
jgi:hypothetical protein